MAFKDLVGPKIFVDRAVLNEDVLCFECMRVMLGLASKLTARQPALGTFQKLGLHHIPISGITHPPVDDSPDQSVPLTVYLYVIDSLDDSPNFKWDV